MIVKFVAVAVGVLLFSSQSMAVVDLYEFDEEQQRLRYLSFIDELRCPKCQNQNLSGSNSPIASDLRREVHRLIVSGHSDDEIIEFMVARYGEYVLYRPRVKGATYILWLAPVGLLVLGAGVLFWVLSRRRVVAKAERVGLTSGQQAKLDALLAARTSQNEEDR